MIIARRVTKTYHLGGQEIRALDGVSLNINRGEYLGVVGASGSGKSTLLNLLAGMDTPTEGDIETPMGWISRMSPQEKARYRRDQVGMVFQTFNLIPHRTALQNVEMALLFSHVSKEERMNRAKQALGELGLESRLQHKPNDMSGGEQQRVALARALVKKPDLLLADEPTGNLDKENAAQISSLLSQVNEKGVTIILVTHDLQLAKDHTHRIIRLSYGEILSETRAP